MSYIFFGFSSLALRSTLYLGNMPLLIFACLIFILLVKLFENSGEGITNYNQIRSDYGWTLYGGAPHKKYDSFYPKPAFGRSFMKKKINPCKTEPLSNNTQIRSDLFYRTQKKFHPLDGREIYKNGLWSGEVDGCI